MEGNNSSTTKPFYNERLFSILSTTTVQNKVRVYACRQEGLRSYFLLRFPVNNSFVLVSYTAVWMLLCHTETDDGMDEVAV